MRNSFIWIVCGIIGMTACRTGSTKQPSGIRRVDQHWLDSIQKNSDTVYSRNYRNAEFVTTDYYVNRGTHTVCQVMRDSAAHPRQIILARNDIRLFTASYYANGQLMADLPLDSSGKYHGYSVAYYPNGRTRSEGPFVHGFFSGDWKYYSEKGTLLYTEQYDAQGQLVRTIGNK